MLQAVAAFLVFAGVLQAADGGKAAELARAIRGISLDPEECYRIRDLTLIREDARIYLTDGYLLFGTPAAGRRIVAVFSADVEGGDGEVIVLPPDRSERQSMANHTNSPNLNEHFSAAVLIFTDDTYEALARQIRAGEFNRKTPEAAALLTQIWSPVMRNLASSFESRLVMDLLANRSHSEGMFVMSMQGKQLGNFDLYYDPRSTEQLSVGQVTVRDTHTYFDVWTSFAARSFRNGTRGLPGPEIELKNYRIEARIEPDLKMKAVTRVTARPSATATRVLPFDISGQVQVDSATIDGQPVEVFQRESLRSNLIRNSANELLLVIPPEPLTAGREYELEFQHGGTVIVEASKQVYSVMSRSNWYPGRGSQFSFFDLTFRYPKEFDLVTPGEVIEDRTEDNWKITRRRTDSAVRFAGFNLGVYRRMRVKRGDHTIEVCGDRALEAAFEPKMQPPIAVTPQVFGRLPSRNDGLRTPLPVPQPSPAARLQELAGEVASALEFMSARFGQPASRILTVSPVPGAWGQGFPGLIYLSALAYLPPTNRTVQRLDEMQRLFFSDILQAHETAHQWWGNVVTSAGYHDDWIMEALANYSALMYLEKRRGARSLEDVLTEYRGNLLAKNNGGKTLESAGPIVLGVRLESSLTPRAWRTITYEKGSWILHMLRRRLGDQKFEAMLLALRQRFEFKPVTTDQLRLLASEFLPLKSPDPKLETFFEQWVYSTGIPKLEMKSAVRGKAPSVKLSVTLKQSEVPADFSALIPVEIQLPLGKSVIEWVQTEGESTETTITLKQAPVKVVLNPNSSVLAN